MGNSKTTIKLTIHFGGTVTREGEDYTYKEELGCKTVHWRFSEISWKKFEDFCVTEAKNGEPIRFIWYKETTKEMKFLLYLFDPISDVDMVDLCLLGETAGELDIFLEQNCSDNSQHESVIYLQGSQDQQRVENKEYKNYSSADEEVDRPKEDEEGLESEDEITDNVAAGGYEAELDDIGDSHNMAAREENVVLRNENVAGARDETLVALNEIVDDGDDVLLDAGDGGDDERFKSLFHEGSRARADIEAYKNCEEQEEEQREAEDSEQECVVEEEAEYPDTPPDSDEEWEQWDNERRGKGSKKDTHGKSKYHGSLDEEPYIWLFQKFNSGLEFKDQLLRYSLKTQYDVKMAKSEANRIAVVCCGKKCKFKVFCSYEKPINKWMVKVCHMNHNHGKSSRVSMLKQSVIAGLFREEIRRNINLQAAQIKDAIKARYNIIVPLSKCYRGRRIALNTILEAQTTQFGKLWDYENELRKRHPHMTTDLCTVNVNDREMFDCFYICFEEFRNTWKTCCRPVIGLDGCFLKWELTGDLLAAVGRDADNRMYPIAWAVVRGENKDTWGWFVKKLKRDLGLENGNNLTIISDKQKGLVLAIETELPNAEHRMCGRHIYANWKKQGFSRSEYKNLFWGVAYSYTEGEYEEKLDLVKAYDPSAYQALLATEPKRWCRAFFNVQSHCADVHNNLSESFNRTIKMARSKPIINLLEDIRRQAMRRVSRRFLKAEKLETPVTPITMALLEKARLAKQYCDTLRSSKNLYEVNEFENGYIVNLATHECACRRWDLTGIPCRHAVCVLDDNQDDPVRYVADYYFTPVFKKTYEENIKPVNGEKLWERTNKPPIGIPDMRKPRGRPKNRDRRKEPFEDLQNQGKSTRHGRIPHCSQCGQAGHNKSSCKNEPVVMEVTKNKRGRPKKLKDESHPKPPPKPRRKRNAPATGSSSQPVLAGESSSQTPVISSAPQPSMSSNQVQPHVKKASRGRPLKIRKTGNIPHGVGTFWSPFTDRPFEVFGDRVYDRSDVNPKTPEDRNKA